MLNLFLLYSHFCTLTALKQNSPLNTKHLRWKNKSTIKFKKRSKSDWLHLSIKSCLQKFHISSIWAFLSLSLSLSPLTLSLTHFSSPLLTLSSVLFILSLHEPQMYCEFHSVNCYVSSFSKVKSKLIMPNSLCLRPPATNDPKQTLLGTTVNSLSLSLFSILLFSVLFNISCCWLLFWMRLWMLLLIWCWFSDTQRNSSNLLPKSFPWKETKFFIVWERDIFTLCGWVFTLSSQETSYSHSNFFTSLHTPRQ